MSFPCTSPQRSSIIDHHDDEAIPRRRQSWYESAQVFDDTWHDDDDNDSDSDHNNDHDNISDDDDDDASGLLNWFRDDTEVDFSSSLSFDPTRDHHHHHATCPATSPSSSPGLLLFEPEDDNDDMSDGDLLFLRRHHIVVSHHDKDQEGTEVTVDTTTTHCPSSSDDDDDDDNDSDDDHHHYKFGTVFQPTWENDCRSARDGNDDHDGNSDHNNGNTIMKRRMIIPTKAKKVFISEKCNQFLATYHQGQNDNDGYYHRENTVVSSELPTPAAVIESSQNPTKKKKKNVHFGLLQIREYMITVGVTIVNDDDHSQVAADGNNPFDRYDPTITDDDDGDHIECPIELDWDYHDMEYVVTISEYESYIQNKRRFERTLFVATTMPSRTSLSLSSSVKVRRYDHVIERRQRIADVCGITVRDVYRLEQERKIVSSSSSRQ